MSKYSGYHDFKDILNINFKDFEDFKSKTNCVIYQLGKDNQFKRCLITNPIDLVKYYSCKISNVTKNGYKYNIYLEPPTAIQEWIADILVDKKYIDEDDINYILEQAKHPETGFTINDPKLIGAYMILFNMPEDKRYII